jgi:hypothetical protein
MTALGRYCCKSLFASPIANSPGRTFDDRIIICGTTSYCGELTGDFGNGLEAISLCDFGSFSQFAGNWPHGILGVLQHYRHETDMPMQSPHVRC